MGSVLFYGEILSGAIRFFFPLGVLWVGHMGHETSDVSCVCTRYHPRLGVMWARVLELQVIFMPCVTSQDHRWHRLDGRHLQGPRHADAHNAWDA